MWLPCVLLHRFDRAIGNRRWSRIFTPLAAGIFSHQNIRCAVRTFSLVIVLLRRHVKKDAQCSSAIVLPRFLHKQWHYLKKWTLDTPPLVARTRGRVAVGRRCDWPLAVILDAYNTNRSASSYRHLRFSIYTTNVAILWRYLVLLATRSFLDKQDGVVPYSGCSDKTAIAKAASKLICSLWCLLTVILYW